MRADKLRVLRDAKGLTKARLGASAGVNHSEKNRAQMNDNYLLENTDNALPPDESPLEEDYPELAKVLRRCGKPPTLEERRRIARIIRAAIEVTDDDI